jgi:RNA polymerase sigma-70 factor, ECF subfamily
MPPSIDNNFIRELTVCQRWLFGYLCTLVSDASAAEDLLQEVNVTAWNKSEDFVSGTSLKAWLSKIAYFHVLNYRRKLSRDRIIFDDETLYQLAIDLENRSVRESDRSRALDKCLGDLPTAQRELLFARYGREESIKTIADACGRTAASISQQLYRLRENLLRCVDARTAEIRS